MEADSLQHVKKCKPCQFHGNLVHAPSVSLQALATPYPFHTWAFDLIGKIHPQSQQHIWILVATELFTKWAEAVPLRKATGAVVSQFILEHIICRFGIPKEIISDNGTPFVNKEMVALTTKYGINHKRSTVAYPQGNGQAEATNKTLLAILTKMRDDYPTSWHEQIPEVLWAYRTTTRKPTGYSPFALVYGAEAVLPVELTVPTVRMSTQGDDFEELRLSQVEAVEELRDKAQKNFKAYTKQQIKAYEGKVRRREFKEGDLVLKTATHIIRGVSANKFAPKWEGPYIIRTVSLSGYCTLSLINSEDKFWVNCKWLKHYYV